jgi:hypothetical protein
MAVNGSKSAVANSDTFWTKSRKPTSVRRSSTSDHCGPASPEQVLRDEHPPVHTTMRTSRGGRSALRVRQSGADLKSPQAGVGQKLTVVNVAKKSEQGFDRCE